MGFEFGKTYCALCIKRPREIGGNDSCPVKNYPFGMAWQLNPQLPNECNYFKAGDRRLKR